MEPRRARDAVVSAHDQINAIIQWRIDLTVQVDRIYEVETGRWRNARCNILGDFVAGRIL